MHPMARIPVLLASQVGMFFRGRLAVRVTRARLAGILGGLLLALLIAVPAGLAGPLTQVAPSPACPPPAGGAVGADGFGTTGCLNTPRSGSTEFSLTRLLDGQLLAAGGTYNGYLSSAELYDPIVGQWTATSPLTTARGRHSATLLPTGKVLIAGGSSTSGVLASTELYDPNTGTWASTGAMATARAGHTALLLADGRVLVVAGYSLGTSDSLGLASAELYDPTTGTWAPTGSLGTARMTQSGVRLADGRVLIAGGKPQGVTFTNLASAELYDPATGVWSPTGAMAIGRREAFSLTRLATGQVLVAGGITDWTAIGTAQAELYDPTTGTWTATTPLPAPRQNHSATLLGDGRVLLVGGNEHPQHFGDGTEMATAYLYDPTAPTWILGGVLKEPRVFQHEARLLDGRVVIVGGSHGSAQLATAELFQPGRTLPSSTPTRTSTPTPTPTRSNTPTLTTGSTITPTATGTRQLHTILLQPSAGLPGTVAIASWSGFPGPCIQVVPPPISVQWDNQQHLTDIVRGYPCQSFSASLAVPPDAPPGGHVVYFWEGTNLFGTAPFTVRSMTSPTATAALVPTTTPTALSTVIASPTASRTLTATASPMAPADVRVDAVPVGDGRLRVTISVAGDTLRAVDFATDPRIPNPNALVDTATPAEPVRTGAAAPLSIALPPGTPAYTFYVRRVTPGLATSLPFTVRLGSGRSVPKFVGGGPDAF